MEKVTKKDMFNEIVALATESHRQDIIEFANRELELLAKRNSKERSANKVKEAERAKLAEEILTVLSEATEPMRTVEISGAVGISPQKATPVLKALVETGKVEKMVEKRTPFFKLAESVEAE